MSDCLQDVCLTNSTISTVMMKILHHLYEMEVISEDVVITWYNSSAVSQAEDLAARKTLREKVRYLKNILKPCKYLQNSYIYVFISQIQIKNILIVSNTL